MNDYINGKDLWLSGGCWAATSSKPTVPLCSVIGSLLGCRQKVGWSGSARRHSQAVRAVVHLQKARMIRNEDDFLVEMEANMYFGPPKRVSGLPDPIGSTDAIRLKRCACRDWLIRWEPMQTFTMSYESQGQPLFTCFVDSVQEAEGWGAYIFDLRQIDISTGLPLRTFFERVNDPDEGKLRVQTMLSRLLHRNGLPVKPTAWRET